MPDFTITSNNPEGLIQQLRAIQQTGCGALTKECWAIASQIEEQVKPAIEEPQEFGSIVRATSNLSLSGTLWQKSPAQGKHYWEDENGCIEVWSELTDVEVLRVGVGDTSAYAKGATDTATKIQIRLRALAAEAITAEQQNAFMKAFEAVGEEA